MQGTRKLYYEDVRCRSFCAVVQACEPLQGGLFRVALDATAFYPEGGGQPADRGALGNARVLDVHEQDDIVWHTCTVPLRIGETVQGDLDWMHRIDCMQQHTGEHIFSGVLHALYGCNNVGFHIGEDAVRVDFDLPLSRAQLEEAERAANLSLLADDPVDISFPTKAALSALTYRSKKELNGAVRIVCAGKADVCACCGLHVEHCSEVGMIKILSAQSYKGGMRILLACGLRAFDDYAVKTTNISEISALLSAKPDETACAVRRLMDEYAAFKQHTAALEQRFFTQTAQTLAAQCKPGNALVSLEADLSPESLRRLCLALCEAADTQTVCAAFSPQADGFAYALGSRSCDVRPLCKLLNDTCTGRGGGKSALTQGSVACTQAELDAFCAAHLAAD